MADPIIIIKDGSTTIEVTDGIGGQVVLRAVLPDRVQIPKGKKPNPQKKGDNGFEITWE